MMRADCTMWPAALRGHPFAVQLAATRAAGCRRLSMNSATFAATKAAGLSAADMRHAALDAGVSISWVDAVTGWLPVRYPPAMLELKGFLDHDADLAFEMAAELGATSLLAIGAFDAGDIEFERQVECFDALCRRAARADLRVGLEFIPMWGIATLSDAWAIVRTANAPNSGVVLDTWHFFRAGAEFELLHSIPGERIFAVQLADAALDVVPEGLLADCLMHRRLPGEGELKLDGLLQILVDKGVRDFGPEIFSVEMDALPADEAARLGVEATLQALTGGEHRSAARR